MAVEQPFQELHGEAGKSISVGNHNFLDSACTDGVQNGEESEAFPVEAAANVFDELVLRVNSPKSMSLTSKFTSFMVGGDPGVADASSLLDDRRRFSPPDEPVEVGKLVEPLALAFAAADDLNFALLSPEAERARTDIVGLADACTTDKLGLQVL